MTLLLLGKPIDSFHAGEESTEKDGVAQDPITIFVDSKEGNHRRAKYTNIFEHCSIDHQKHHADFNCKKKKLSVKLESH